MKKNKIVSVSLSEKDFKKLRSQAYKNEMSLSYLIRQKLGFEEKIEDENFDPLLDDMNKKIEDSKKREEEKVKKLEEEQAKLLEKEMQNNETINDFSTDFSSPPSFDR